jgi:hypothetical protein
MQEVNINSISQEREFNGVWDLFEEAMRNIKASDPKFKPTPENVGGLAASQSIFLQGFVAPSVFEMFRKRNIEIERISSCSKSYKSGQGRIPTMEIDIIGDNSAYVVAIEVKSKLLSKNIIDFLEKLDKFKYFFPNYTDKKLIGAVAGISVDKSVKNFAEKKGFFVIMQKGEAVEIVNEQNFTPKVW